MTRAKPTLLGNVILYLCISKDGAFVEREYRFMTLQDAEAWCGGFLKKKKVKPFADGAMIYKEIMVCRNNEIDDYRTMRAKLRIELECWRREIPLSGDSLFD